MNKNWDQQSSGSMDQVAHHQAKNERESDADCSRRKAALIVQEAKPDRLQNDCTARTNLVRKMRQQDASEYPFLMRGIDNGKTNSQWN